MPTAQRYEVLSMEVHKQWNWNRGEDKGNGYASTSTTCRARCAATRTCACWSPAATTTSARRTSATDWSLAQLDAPPDVLARVEHHYYDAGHMMYTREADLMKLKDDLVAWLAR